MPMTPIRSIIMSGGQGDAMMAACGLHALVQSDPGMLADDAVAYTRSIATPLIAVMLDGIEVTSIEHSRGAARPRYYTSAETSGSATLRNLFGRDFYVNFAAPRRRASTGFAPPGGFAGWFERLNEARLFGSRDWRRVTPGYYGLRMWIPAAAALGLSAIDLLRGLHRSRPILTERLRTHAAGLTPPDWLPRIAIFPVGKAYQTMPPAFVAALVDGLAADDYACCFAPGDPSIARYEALGLHCRTTPDIASVLTVVAGAVHVATVDSFVSHLAQLAAHHHVAFMSHDLPEHTVHPAAASELVFTAMPCVPCNYNLRQHHDRCAAGHPACGVYADADYLARGRAALRREAVV